MIRSMTGFGRFETVGTDQGFTIELRAVNNRYLDVQVKLPRALSALESRIKKAVQEKCGRGRVDVFINRSGSAEKTNKLSVDALLAEHYVSALRELKNRYDLPGEVELSLVAGMQDIFVVTEEREDAEETWKALSDGLGRALDQLDRMRIEEGAALSADMAARLDTITSVLGSIALRSEESVELARRRMTERIAKLLTEQPDPARIAQEIAILAERTDVTEELTRLKSHLAQYRAMITDRSPESIGRKLDFLLQEMVREVNTIASKALDSQISFQVVTIKAELEKVREQAQNIE